MSTAEEPPAMAADPAAGRLKFPVALIALHENEVRRYRHFKLEFIVQPPEDRPTLCAVSKFQKSERTNPSILLRDLRTARSAKLPSLKVFISGGMLPVFGKFRNCFLDVVMQGVEKEGASFTSGEEKARTILCLDRR